MPEPLEYPTGEHFFHYTTREAAFEHILPTKQLRFSTYQRMRDPLENRAEWRFVATWWPAAIAEDPDAPEKAFFQFNRLANSIRKRAQLLALTIDAEDEWYRDDAEDFGRGWARARMWEPYAEDHAGVCLMFNREALKQKVSDSIHKQLGVRPYNRKVVYSPTGPERDHLDAVELAKQGVTPESVAKYIDDHNDQLFFQKTLDWATEYEYRFVTVTEEERELYVDYGDALEAVIVGEKFPDWQRPGAIEACRAANADALRLDWSMDRPVPALLKVKRPPSQDDSIEDRIDRLRSRLQEGHAPPPAP